MGAGRGLLQADGAGVKGSGAGGMEALRQRERDGGLVFGGPCTLGSWMPSQAHSAWAHRLLAGRGGPGTEPCLSPKYLSPKDLRTSTSQETSPLHTGGRRRGVPQQWAKEPRPG